uniref:SBP-type domain-containing protein n=1 Tax=Opuntia streptacantha TaxID=393608 RepID=A0A7C9F9R2_OPUST
MEAKFGGKTDLYGPVVTDMKAVGKRTLEWDLNDWRWDGDRLLASPLNPVPSDCRSRQFFPVDAEIPANVNLSSSSSPFSEEISPTAEKGKRELEKRRRAVAEGELNDEAAQLSLKLGHQIYPITEEEVDKWEGKSGKKTKLDGTSSNHPACQVEDCRADLSNAKDYHRRHKVCEMHSKASKALVGNVMQRFCQQCSRFHLLQEFDEGKRSCRRRLAGHNKRRRKTHPETSANVASLTDERSAGYLLITLLRILSNLHTNGSEQSKDQDLLSHLLRNLAGSQNGSSISELMQGSQGLLNVGTPARIPEKDPSRTQEHLHTAPSAEAHRGVSSKENMGVMQQILSAAQSTVLHASSNLGPPIGRLQDADRERHMHTNIDLNNAYNDEQDCVGHQEKGHSSVPIPFWAEQSVHKSSAPQTSGNSESTSGQSGSSGSDSQSRTDRIVFKLFGKDPNDLPRLLRTQILDWLSQSPTDIEGYIRPGCIVLTIYLRLNKSLWEEFYRDMSSSLIRLLDVSNDPFWKTGWIYTRVQQRAAFICDGRVVLDTPLPFNQRSRILSISPIAVSADQRVQLVVKGSNLFRPSSRLLCAVEGRYLLQEGCHGLVEGGDTAAEHDEVQSLSFHCSMPDVIGRGFIEVEDYGLSGCFFPFIVAEAEICSEICMLEKVIEMAGSDDCSIEGQCEKLEARNGALDFIHEMGWLLHRTRLRFKSGHANPQFDPFPFERLKWLLEFSMDHDWCAVLRKLLDLLFSGITDVGEYACIERAVLEMGLLHAAVQRNSRPVVEFLLGYIPKMAKSTSDHEEGKPSCGPPSSFLFRPDVAGAGGLTPLHIAASSDGSESVLDALLEDPKMVGIEAWQNARDSTGLTPSDYASLRGHYRYLHLARAKISKKSSGKHVVVDIPLIPNPKLDRSQTDKLKTPKASSFYTEKLQLRSGCKLCERNLDCAYRRPALTYRPAMLSLLVIAVVCVCTALFFRSAPQVCHVFGPLRWESLKYGAM